MSDFKAKVHQIRFVFKGRETTGGKEGQVKGRGRWGGEGKEGWPNKIGNNWKSGSASDYDLQPVKISIERVSDVPFIVQLINTCYTCSRVSFC